jgi:hypothetical protein
MSKGKLGNVFFEECRSDPARHPHLAGALPPVIADAGALLRQVALSLIGNSIHLANAGGQVHPLHRISAKWFSGDRDRGPGLKTTKSKRPQPRAVGSVFRRLRRQPAADQGAGRGQPRAIPHQDGCAFRHADRSGVFARDGQGLKSARKLLRESVAP